MLAAEVYKRFLLKINKNDTNSNIDISRGEFVLLYNEQKDRWLKEKIEKGQSSDGVDDISELQLKHIPLQFISSTDKYSIFQLPENFFSYLSSYSLCSKGDCRNVVVRHFRMKPKNENMLLESSNTQPSFEYEETVVDLSGNSIFVYKDDFSVDATLLNYYKEVGDIDIAGYRKLDGTSSVDIHPDIKDVYVDEILNRSVIEVIRRYENPDGFQLAQNRLQSE